MTTLLSVERIATALDNAHNGFGMELTTDARARIFAAIDEPSMTTWIAARAIIITHVVIAGGTLWQAVCRHHAMPPHGEPTSFMILNAMERSTR